MPRLLTDATNGDGEWVQVPADGRPGVQPRLFAVWGTFDGASVKLQHSFDGGVTAIDGYGIATSEANVMSVYVAAGSRVRAVVASGGGSEELNAELV